MKSAQFAEQLTYQRKLRGLSQEQLAEKTKVTVRTIQRIEKGTVTPHLRTVKLLAAALEIDVDDLLQLDDPREENIQTKWLVALRGAFTSVGFISISISLRFRKESRCDSGRSKNPFSFILPLLWSEVF